ncbi:polyunsaturated fatty acid lipoxygenase ALOX15B-like isoform X1 [Dreissena polymorpha]|uniref:polyunsaturated fatty acid lipoxygenase ALOX15B-like isoform X1 n=1 Tax=Dreissena polymorpha TaxID=45954 RepID=UPI002263FF26|nr:polyunsaturated fatty acid lipoxygenase ALOX15B-like isoform X1 [Dreissena polymorpha]
MAFTINHNNKQWEKVDTMQLWKHGDGENTEWMVEKITETECIYGTYSQGVERCAPQLFSPIAVSVNEQREPLLPKYDPDQDRRREILDGERKLFEYTQRATGIPCQVKVVPRLNPGHYTKAVEDIKKLTTAIAHKKGDWTNINDVKKIFGCLFPHPSDITRWEDDVKFGMQRFAGTHNTVIRLCTEIPEKLAVTPAMLKPLLENDTLQSAIKKRRLFIIDHSILRNCPTIKGTVVCSPIALFYRRDDNKIVPIAIQLFQDKAHDNPVFLPSDPKYTWILAKMWFNNADACVHQANTHLGYTHIVMEGFEVSINRNLSKSHPMFKIMAPHFMYLMTINYLALSILLGEGQFMNTVVSVGTEGAYELIRRYRSKWRLNVEGTLPADLKERGVDSTDVVPDYPFRDDALLTYNAILKYVTDYVHLYYPSDKELFEDYEIQNWRADLERPIHDGGLGILGVEGVDGRFTSREQLIQVVTSIIYTCSAGHAAANFKQYDEYAYPMNYPSMLRGKPPSDRGSRSEVDVIQTIQHRLNHYQLMTIVKVLSDHSFGNQLGNFDQRYIYDPKAMHIVQKFRADLCKIHRKIQKANMGREITYDYMDPLVIPNSINI